MSNIFLKNELNSIFDETEVSVDLPKFISIVDRANKVDDDRTSSASVPTQLGGFLTVTSANSSSSQDVNKLISMITSESSSANMMLSQTSTDNLENQLRQILGQDGGARNNKSKQRGGEDNINVEDVKKFFMKLKSDGVNVNVKLNDKSMSEFFDSNQNTTTEIPKPDNSESSSVNIKDIIGSDNQSGGAKKRRGAKKASKKASKKSSKKASKKSMKGGAEDMEGGAKRKKKGSKKSSKKDMDGGVNAGFQAFLDLKKHIAEKLGISNGPAAAKVAGAVQKDMKEKHPGKDAVTIAKAGREHFDANMDHYKQMLPK